MTWIEMMDLTHQKNQKVYKPLLTRYFKYRVLLVEDSRESAELVKAVCEKVDGDMYLKCVPTAEMALDILQLNPYYNLVIADQFLEGEKTGLDLWRLCKTKYKHIPFLMTTSLDRDEFSNLTKNEAPPWHLSKPFYKKDCQLFVELLLKKKGAS